MHFRELDPHTWSLESVDHRLRDLIRELQDYRLRLETKVSSRYREFERHVLEAILYSADFDTFGALHRISLPTSEDQNDLIGVFREVGILDSKMKDRIGVHFAQAKKSLKKLQRDTTSWNIDDVFIIPLMRRTRSLAAEARDLRAQRDKIFLPLRRYEEIVNSFLRDKRATVIEDGTLTIH